MEYANNTNTKYLKIVDEYEDKGNPDKHILTDNNNNTYFYYPDYYQKLDNCF